MEELVTSVSELRCALDTFYLLISGVLVMWMAAGFAMLEAGLVRAKNTTEILTKNILLYAIACIMFLLVGYNIMYVDNSAGGWLPITRRSTRRKCSTPRCGKPPVTGAGTRKTCSR